jgi:flagellar motility protein MotE (MotC chaperone)
MSLLRIPPRALLPLLIFISVLAVGLRTGDVWDAMVSGAAFAPIKHVQAEEKAPAETQAATPTPEAQPAPSALASDAPSAPPEDESAAENDLYKQLAGRRDQLEARKKELDSREVVIKIAEQRVDQKLQEMATLRDQLEKLLGQASGAQATQLENLVKIYETMKPKEAARIFETLDMSVLLNVVQRMKPARTAAVMAEMDPLKAREITIALTRRDQLPQLK